MIKIYWDNKDPILTLKRANLATMRLKPKDNKMSPETFSKMLRAEHSTLRFLNIIIDDDDMPYTTAMHIVRHTKDQCQHEVSSGRPDLIGKARDYSLTRFYIGKYTPIGLIRMMEQRLCNKAEDVTRAWAGCVLIGLLKSEDIYLQEVSKLCRPKCEKLGYCPEIKGCGAYPGRGDGR